MSDAETIGNRREFLRVKTRPHVRISSADGADEWTAFVLDISIRGLLIEGESVLDLDTNVQIQILLGVGPGSFAINAKGIIVRSDAHGTAIELTELEDPESFEHWRKLVLYNSREPESVEEECQQHVGISSTRELDESGATQ